ncbi:pilus assembly PilX family protein [Noviherbaspirillum aridicola]|uniref:Tfp pilus assembly protein PilX n=1 Tax=Noviherbaspirillum aridicola TaxID=2849687 RepID=A0ABQ4Q0V6_9BURK|nr:hypothetical protein [Noviherbaspirillum aridicola]GIZ50425.1 hypothetical protein NCCP691_04390 [Noviherbaspirillum aridicola]
MKPHYRMPARRQEGVVLLIAVVVLVAMTMAALGLVRSIDTGNQVAGNLAFKQAATAAADIGTQAAIDWLTARVGTPDVNEDMPTQAYYATSQDSLDITGTRAAADRAQVDWDANNCRGRPNSSCIAPSAAIDAGAGNEVRYLIHRLCSSPGSPAAEGNSCANYQSRASSAPNKDGFDETNWQRFEPPPVPYYRITSRVKGPRNTVSYVETIVHF